MSTSAQQDPTLTTPSERRFYPRIVPHAPIFVAFGENNEGVLLNVSENGLLVSTPAELKCNFVARIAIPFNDLPQPVQVNVRVVWTSEAGKRAGIQLLDLSDHDREQIRKWGTQESAQPSLPEPNYPAVADEPSATSSPAAQATPSFMEESRFSRLPVEPLHRRLIVRRRSSSVATGVAWGALIAIVCLAAVFFLKSGAPGNPFARSAENPNDSSAAPPPQDLQGGLQNGSLNHPAPVASSLSGAKSKSALLNASPPQTAQTSDHTFDADDPGSSTVDTIQNQNQRNPSRTDSISLSKPILETNPTRSASSRPIAEPHADVRNDPALIDPAPKGIAAASPTTPSDAIPEAPPVLPEEPIRSPLPANNVASTRAASSRKSDASIIQMDAPGGQVMEIHPPARTHASFFNLPGERVLESPSVTMHIQRSVRMPTTHVWWPFHRNKKVVVGELISRVDPQAAQVHIGSSSHTVRVKATVVEDGRIENVTPLSGPANLVPAVVRAVHEWRYEPTLMDDKPVETECYVVVQFHGPAGRDATQ